MTVGRILLNTLCSCQVAETFADSTVYVQYSSLSWQLRIRNIRQLNMTPGPERKGYNRFVPGTPIRKIPSPPPARLPIFEETPAEAPTKAVPGAEVPALIHTDLPEVAQSPCPLEEAVH